MQIIQRGVIFSDADPQSPTRVACFPSLARLSDGRILCIFRVGSAKDSADETFRIMQSSDEGQSWQSLPFFPDTALDGVPGGFRLQHLIETRPGELLLVANWINHQDPTAPIAHPQTSGCLPMHIVMFRSSDKGATWSEAEEVTTIPFPQPELSGPIIALQEAGHFLIPMENQKEYSDPGPIDEKAYALISRDYGVTWNEWSMIVHDPARSYWCNRAARFPDTGRIICFSWSYDNAAQQDLPIHIIYGSPDGRVWTQPQSSGVLGQLSTPFPLSETSVLMGYVHRHQPASIRLRVSDDGGATWNAAEELIVFDGEAGAPTDGYGGDIQEYYSYMVNYTFGWNPMIRLQSGNVLLAYFAGTPEMMEIRFAMINVSTLEVN